MVNVISHFGVGLLIALALGLKGNKLKVVALLSVLPDLDFILYSIFIYANSSLSPAVRNQLFFIWSGTESSCILSFSLFWLRLSSGLRQRIGFLRLEDSNLFSFTLTWIMSQAGKCVPCTRSVRMLPL